MIHDIKWIMEYHLHVACLAPSYIHDYDTNDLMFQGFIAYEEVLNDI